MSSAGVAQCNNSRSAPGQRPAIAARSRRIRRRDARRGLEQIRTPRRPRRADREIAHPPDPPPDHPSCPPTVPPVAPDLGAGRHEAGRPAGGIHTEPCND
ncbi:hypothetical protein PVAP13_6NG016043 [Panicum virgatum]|uniref:Uncharacterized protein n=1 Tax=Panicum virgatum TaxID=38727 RepID=A0A8T0QT38_PANVG|nr:hypothetical protein PVAP13_6NG016043 [Panicum virgatum]